MAVSMLVIEKDLKGQGKLYNTLLNRGYSFTISKDHKAALEQLNLYPNKFQVLLLDTNLVRKHQNILNDINNNNRLSNLALMLQYENDKQDYKVNQENISNPSYYFSSQDILKTLEQIKLRDTDELEYMFSTEYKSLNFMRNGTYEIRSLKEAKLISHYLASICPKPKNALLGLTELILNAIEHGNLEIDYQEKTRLKERNLWENEIERRLALSKNKSKVVTINFRANDDNSINFRITDSGNGFNFTEFDKTEPKQLLNSHGRGIFMAKEIGFDKLNYLGNGNIVEARILRTAPNTEAETQTITNTIEK